MRHGCEESNPGRRRWWAPALIVLLVAAIPIGLTAEETSEVTRPVEKGDWLDVANFGGDIVINTWEKSAVRVRAEHAEGDAILADREGRTLRVVSSSWREGARSQSISGDRVVIKLEGATRPGLVRYRIDVPVWMNVRARGVVSAVRITGVSGSVEVSCVDGAVRLDDLGGAVEVEALRGSLEASGIRRSLDASVGGGNATLKESGGTLSIESTTGSIALSGISGATLRARTVTGRIDWTGPVRAGDSVALSTHSGGVAVSLPADPGADLEVKTLRGTVRSDYPIDLGGGDGVKRARASLGNATGGRLEIETFSGRIEIRREK